MTWGYDIFGGDSGAVLLVPVTAATATTSATIWNSATTGAFDDAQNGGLNRCRLFMPTDFSFSNPAHAECRPVKLRRAKLGAGGGRPWKARPWPGSLDRRGLVGLCWCCQAVVSRIRTSNPFQILAPSLLPNSSHWYPIFPVTHADAETLFRTRSANFIEPVIEILLGALVMV